MNRGLPQAGQTEKPHPAGSHTVSNLLISSIFTSTSCKEAPLIKKKKNPGTNGCILAGWALEGETPHILSNCTTEIANAGDTGSIPGLERSPGEGSGNPCQ